MRPLGLLATAAPLLAAVLLAGAPPVSAAVAPPGRLSVHSRTVEFGPTATPRLFTIACAPDEVLVSGGFSGFNTFAQVVFSFPSDARGTPARPGEQPRGWTIGVLNSTQNVLTLQVVAGCLADSGLGSSVVANTETRSESSFSLTAGCPGGTVRTGGGHSAQWTPNLGGTAAYGSYPAPEQRWGLDVALLPGDPDIKARTTVTAYAVCLAGKVAIADSDPVELTLTRATPLCTGADAVFTPTCVTPQAGAQTVACRGDLVLTSGGYQVIAGALPGSRAVLVNAPSTTGTWTVGIRGSTPTPEPVSIRITPLCLAAAAEPVATEPAGSPLDPPLDLSAGEPDWPVILGVGGFFLLLLLLLALLAARAVLRNRSRPVPAARLDVVVRATRAGYRLGEFREIT